MVELSPSDETPRDHDKSETHLLERIGAAAEEKEVVYGVEVEALLYFCIRSKYHMGPCDRIDEKVKQQGHRLRQSVWGSSAAAWR